MFSQKVFFRIVVVLVAVLLMISTGHSWGQALSSPVIEEAVHHQGVHSNLRDLSPQPERLTQSSLTAIEKSSQILSVARLAETDAERDRIGQLRIRPLENSGQLPEWVYPRAYRKSEASESNKVSVYTPHAGGATTCTVSSTADSGVGTLRQCLLDAVAGDRIEFTASGTIQLATPLPDIVVDNLIIDASGTTIALDGSLLPSGSDGLSIRGTNGVAVYGLEIYGFTGTAVLISEGAQNTLIGGAASANYANIIGNNWTAIAVVGEDSNNNVISNNYIGIDSTGLFAMPNDWGIVIAYGAQDNVIGGNSNAAGNLISRNSKAIVLQNEGTSGNQIRGNYIGYDPLCPFFGGNQWGVGIVLGADHNIVGGSEAGARNIISCNSVSGVQLEDTDAQGTQGNQIIGNYVGTDSSGTVAYANGSGVVIGFGAKNNVIGGTVSGTGNLISGNSGPGIQIQNEGTQNNSVLGNLIGVNASGMEALGNGTGVLISGGATLNIVGGAEDGSRNILSGNIEGIQIQEPGTNENKVLGNYIGTNLAGDASIPNSTGVMIISGPQNNQIGGSQSGAGNLISGNRDGGIQVQALFVPEPGGTNVLLGEPIIYPTDGNRILGNRIGTDSTGTMPLGNENGVVLGYGASSNFVGGALEGEGNFISGNDFGVWIHSQENITSQNNDIIGNYIGTNISGTAILSNTWGIIIEDGSPNNRVVDNLISGNSARGIEIRGLGTDNNEVLGNYIGTDADGATDLPNAVGVMIAFGAKNNIVGGTAVTDRNVISGNSGPGVQIQNNGSDGNQILGNYIGTTIDGDAPLPNGDGIGIIDGAQSNIVGGTSELARNIISGNLDTGIQIQDVETRNNKVLGNYIGLDVSGTFAISDTLNGTSGVILVKAQNNFVGGIEEGAENVIGGHTIGLQIQQEGATGNQIQGNKIGTNAEGSLPIPNFEGIVVGFGASNNVIGGEVPNTGNLISGNENHGVSIACSSTTNNHVWGNFIGTDITGNAPLGNGYTGVFIAEGAQGNQVGSSSVNTRNIISGNGKEGVLIQGEVGGMCPSPRQVESVITKDNVVQGNYIGTNIDGTQAIPNHWGVGVSFGAQDNIIGGTNDARNLISGNNATGVQLQELGTDNNQILGNYIGTDVTGSIALANDDGVAIGLGSQKNVVGGSEAEVRNIISGNRDSGVVILGDETTDNQILGNYIGTDSLGETAVGNKNGILIEAGAQDNAIGGPNGAGNLISGNQTMVDGGHGIWLLGSNTSGNQIIANTIGTNLSQTGPLPNTGHGIYISDGAHENTIGPGNAIIYNGLSGVAILGDEARENIITRNTIYSNDGDEIIFLNTPIPIALPTLNLLNDGKTITGTICPNCTLELFVNTNREPAGEVYTATVKVDDTGVVSYTITKLTPLDFVAATITEDGATAGFFPVCKEDEECGPSRVYLPMIVRDS